MNVLPYSVEVVALLIVYTPSNDSAGAASFQFAQSMITKLNELNSLLEAKGITTFRRVALVHGGVSAAEKDADATDISIGEREDTRRKAIVDLMKGWPLVPSMVTPSVCDSLAQWLGGLPPNDLLLLDRQTGAVVSEPGLPARWLAISSDKLASQYPWQQPLAEMLAEIPLDATYSAGASVRDRIRASAENGEKYFAVCFLDDSPSSSRVLMRLLELSTIVTELPHILVVYEGNMANFARETKGSTSKWAVLSAQEADAANLKMKLRVTSTPGVALLSPELQLINPNAVHNLMFSPGLYPWFQDISPPAETIFSGKNQLKRLKVKKEQGIAWPAIKVLLPDYNLCREWMIDRDGVVTCLYEAKSGSGFSSFIEVRCLVHRKVVQLWALVEFGRRVFRRQVLTSDGDFNLMSGRVPPVEKTSWQGLTQLVSPNKLIAAPLYFFGRSVIIHRQRDHAMYIPSHMLEGVLPAVLLANFSFWNTGDALHGEPVPGALSCFTAVKLLVELSPLTDDPTDRWLGASVQRIEKGGGSPLLLFDLLQRPERGSYVWRIAELMSRLDSLTHVLAWASKEKGVELIELPRIGTSFAPRAGPHGETLLFNCDLGELSIAEDAPEAVMNLSRGIPHSIILRDREGAYHFMVANRYMRLPYKVIEGAPGMQGVPSRL
jgi:hypothetical protein